MGEGRTSLLVRLFDEPFTQITDPYLARAYSLAEQARGATHPNPLVGCVIVGGDSVVGEGLHAKSGEPHAEIVALRDAGTRAKGSTAFVTLEPCNHTGQTPPCTRALIDAGVSRVVIGCADPNPAVTGGGADALRAAGIDVEFAADPEVFEAQNADWRNWIVTGRPWVTVKTALTLDGHATSTHDARTFITGHEARFVTMALRERATAAAVGARTALIDRPHLDLETHSLHGQQPLRAVLSGGSATTPGALARVLGEDPSRAWTIVSPNATPDATAERPENVDFVAYDRAGGLASALEVLGSMGIVHLLVEAGPGLFTSFWNDRLIDELVIYHAGGVVGPHAPPTYRTTDLQAVSRLDRPFAIRETGIAGADAVTVWRPADLSAA